MHEIWNNYPLDEYYNKYGNTSKPLLITHGTLDPQTMFEWGQTAFSHYVTSSNSTSTNNKYFVEIPYAVHATAFPGRSQTADGKNPSCVSDIISSFFASIGGQPDTSCLQQLVTPDFAATSDPVIALSVEYFGTEDAWGIE